MPSFQPKKIGAKIGTTKFGDKVGKSCSTKSCSTKEHIYLLKQAIMKKMLTTEN